MRLHRLFDFSELMAISSFAGERFDLVQAGGGNSSAKLADGRIYVKASGVALGDAKGESDFCCLDWKLLSDFVQAIDSVSDVRALEEKANALVVLATKSTNIKPSIETLLHCLLGPLTLHTHPIAVNIVGCRQNWKANLKTLFPDALLIDYVTPGAPLAVSLNHALREHGWNYGEPTTAFLQNHGLIVTAPSPGEIIERTEKVVDTIAEHFSLDLSHYRLTNFASRLTKEATGEPCIALLCDSLVLSQQLESNPELFFASPALPDQLAYCGVTSLEVDAYAYPEGLKRVHEFVKRYNSPPHLMIVRCGNSRHLVVVAKTIRKCREIEDVLKSHILILKAGKSSSVQFLSESEISYLSNWDAEKYRQTI